MGRHRKNHKQKVASFKQRKKDSENRVKKMQKMFIENYIQQQEKARKEFMVETIYTNRNELVKEVDGVWTLNDEAVETQNNMLVWKADGNPILAGLETSMDAYTEYSADLLNQLLPQIQQRLKWRAEKEAAKNNNFNVELVENPEYEISGGLSDVTEAEVIDESKD
jgi:hypothetical protein